MNQIIIRIKSLFDKSGTDSAKRETGKVAEAAKDTGEESGKAAVRSTTAFRAIASASSAANGSISGIGGTLSSLSAMMPVVSSAMLGPIGLAAAAFTALAKIINTVVASLEAAKAALRENEAANTEARISSLSAAYTRLYENIDRAADSRRRLSDAEAGKDDAVFARDLAQLELEKQTALDKTEDAAARKQIELDFAKRKAEVQQAADRRKLDREADSTTDEIAKQTDIGFAAREEQRDLKEVIQRLFRQSNNAQEVMNRRHDSAWTPWGQKQALDDGIKEMERLAALKDSAMVKLKDAMDRERASENTRESLEAKRDTFAIRGQTQQLQRSTSGAQFSAQQRGIDNEAVDSVLKQFNDYHNDIDPRIAAAAQNAIHEAQQTGKLSVGVIQDISAIIISQNGNLRLMQYEIDKLKSQLRYR